MISLHLLDLLDEATIASFLGQPMRNTIPAKRSKSRSAVAMGNGKGAVLLAFLWLLQAKARPSWAWIIHHRKNPVQEVFGDESNLSPKRYHSTTTKVVDYRRRRTTRLAIASRSSLFSHASSASSGISQILSKPQQLLSLIRRIIQLITPASKMVEGKEAAVVAATTSAAAATNTDLIAVSTPSLLLMGVPFGAIALICARMGLLNMSSGLLTGALRTFLQLSILGSILRPIFLWGNKWLVLGYAFCMTVLAAYESSSRTKYIFENQFFCILGSLVFNVSWVAIFCFGIILQPTPRWNPRYVIPIVGMILGNSVSAIALSLNTLTKSLVEQQAEIELYQSFGATKFEAVGRLFEEAMQAGATPILNTMRVIGIISIPGMMTGQILGGSAAMTAARYQMLIIYLIATSVFGVILMNAWIALEGSFDTHHILRTEKFSKNNQLSFTKLLVLVLSGVGSWGKSALPFLSRKTSIELQQHPLAPAANQETLHSAPVPSSPKSELQIRSLREANAKYTENDFVLHVSNLSHSFVIQKDDDENNHGSSTRRLTLFRNVTMTVGPGDLLLVSGPSGVGKSSLLRTLGGISPMMEEEPGFAGMSLAGRRWHKDYLGSKASSEWRRHVRYVTQSKVSIPGTPRDFMERFSTFQSWKDHPEPSKDDIILETERLLKNWGMDSDSLDKDWSKLSGGEAQRVIVALALATKPKLILFDESTSALDLDSKLAVEDSVKEFVHSRKGAALWISHDEKQAERMSQFGGEEQVCDS